jgi:hypothetical protein
MIWKWIKSRTQKNPPSLLSLPEVLTQILNEIDKRPSDRLLNQPITLNIYNGPVQIGNKTVTLQYQLHFINNFIDHLDSSGFADAEIRKANQEFQTLYDNLDEQERNTLCDNAKKLIEEKANKDSVFMEKLRHFGNRVANKSVEVGTGVLIDYIASYAMRLAGMG